MFGMSFGELVVLILVAMVIFGPKELPKILRKVGQYAGKIRRFAADMRQQSGIDDAIRSEGIAEDLAEIRKLARGEIGGVVAAGRSLDALTRGNDDVANSPYAAPYTPPVTNDDPGLVVYREREYPREGADSCGALPDTAIVYAETLPRSKWATDRLYVLGEEGPPLELEDPAPEEAHAPEPAPEAAPSAGMSVESKA